MFGIIVAVVFGGLINWLFAHVYYTRAASELRVEAGELRNLMRIMLVAMEEQGWAKLNRDGLGNIIGFKFERMAADQVNVRDVATAEVSGRGPQLKFEGALDVKHIPGTAEKD